MRDATGALVPDAEATAVNQYTNETKSAHTGGRGQYALAQMPVGVYRIAVRRAGFRTVEEKDVELTALQSLRADFRLEVGQISESVTVTAETPEVDTRSAVYGMLVDDRRVQDLPVVNAFQAVDLRLEDFLRKRMAAQGQTLPQIEEQLGRTWRTKRTSQECHDVARRPQADR